MPLHDWTDRNGSHGFRHLWICELLRWIKPRLPASYRVLIRNVPTVDFSETGESDHDLEEMAASLFVESEGRLISAVEIISPRNKDRPSARANYAARYVGYLLEGVHLLLVDVHRRPLGFSFPEAIDRELQLEPHACPTPCAAAYRVGEPAATGGHNLAIWRRSLAVDSPLPKLLLPLTVELSVQVDLERTYMSAAADAYLA